MTTTAAHTASATPSVEITPILQMSGVTAGYRRTTVLRGVDLAVRPGQVVALLGPNGAGKTTTLRTAAGLIRPTDGAVHLDGRDVTGVTPHTRARQGLCLIPEGRGVFRSLTVRENLRMLVPPWADTRTGLDLALEAFPVLGQRLNQVAGTMSGGQQQMLALCRAYVSEPRVVLLDEVSMGLAPAVVDEIFLALLELKRRGVALLLVEQYVQRALAIADAAVLLDRGVVTFAGPPTELDEATMLRGYLRVDADSPSSAHPRSPIPEG